MSFTLIGLTAKGKGACFGGEKNSLMRVPKPPKFDPHATASLLFTGPLAAGLELKKSFRLSPTPVPKDVCVKGASLRSRTLTGRSVRNCLRLDQKLSGMRMAGASNLGTAEAGTRNPPPRAGRGNFGSLGFWGPRVVNFFRTRAGLPLKEPKQLEAWYGGNLYERILETRKGKPLFVLHDGPPYPTGEIHLGTGLNKILKDLVVKTKSMAGHYAPYVPGWDCHGLPIETQVEKELGGKGKVPPAEFRKLCRQFAVRYVEQHKKDFKRLGIFGRWNDPYLTMSHEYEATIAGAFLDFMEKGYVYRGRKPVYWCIYDSTALAEAEVEYEDHTSPSIWVKFAVVGGGKGEAAKIASDVSAVIWTTTPWTLPHNRALAFHPDFDYAVVETEKGALLLAADRVAAIEAEGGIKEARVRAP